MAVHGVNITVAPRDQPALGFFPQVQMILHWYMALALPVRYKKSLIHEGNYSLNCSSAILENVLFNDKFD